MNRTLNGFPGAEEPEAPQTADFFIRLMDDDRLQSFLAQHLAKDILLSEIKRRELIEPLMNCKDLAQVLGITLQGLYKRIQHNELGIPYVPIGQGGGYKFDPRDVRDFIRKRKIHPVVKPASLRKKAGL